METKAQYDGFKGLPWFPKQDIHVLVGGAGGIGSWLSFLLARAGFKPLVFDFDSIEEGNLGGQLYPKRMVGMSKVAALTRVIKEFSDEEIITMDERIDKNSPTHTYCIAAFDNIEARKAMFNSWEKEHSLNSIFIDGRLEAEQMFIYCVTAENVDMYRAIIDAETDQNIEAALCTMKQTSHAAAMIASHMVAFFTNHVTNVAVGSKQRLIPFSWEYFIPLCLLEEKFTEGEDAGALTKLKADALTKLELETAMKELDKDLNELPLVIEEEKEDKDEDMYF